MVSGIGTATPQIVQAMDAGTLTVDSQQYIPKLPHGDWNVLHVNYYSIFLSLFLSISLSFYLLSFYLSIFLSFYLSIFLSFYLCLFIYLYMCT